MKIEDFRFGKGFCALSNNSVQDKTVNAALSAFFHCHDPELELVDYQSNHTARFRLLDCDGYLVGEMVCEEVLVLCLSTRGKSYKEISVFQRHELPERFSWIEEWMRESAGDDFELVELIPFHDDEDRDFFLPPMQGIPVGYIVCKKISLRARTNEATPERY